MRTYTLIYLDKQKNELKREKIIAYNWKEARDIRDRKFAVSQLNSLSKIKIA